MTSTLYWLGCALMGWADEYHLVIGGDENGMRGKRGPVMPWLAGWRPRRPGASVDRQATKCGWKAGR